MRGYDITVITMITASLLGMAGLSSAASRGEPGFAAENQQSICGGCHLGAAAPQVVFEGPTEVGVGTWNSYKITIKQAGLKAGGFAVAASAGRLDPWTLKTQLSAGELIHTAPILPQPDGTVALVFDWTAPGTPGRYRLSSAVAAVNHDGSAKGDGVARAVLEVVVGGEESDARLLPQGESPAEAAAAIPEYAPNMLPQAMITSPTAGIVGEGLFFSAINSSDADGKITAYHWDLGDGSEMKLPANTHSYRAPGSYNVVLTVTDDGGQTATAYTTVTVHQPQGNQPPQANPGGPYAAVLGQMVAFNAGKSKDPDGRIVSYRWDFGDGYTASGPSVGHIYEQPGFYNVQLSVEDNQGLPGNAAIGVEVRGGGDVIVRAFEAAPKAVLAEGKVVALELIIKTQVQGIDSHTTVCGRAFLERNKTIAQEQTVCYQGEAPAYVTFPVKLTPEDAPEVQWGAYVELDNGEKSINLERKTEVILSAAPP